MRDIKHQSETSETECAPAERCPDEFRESQVTLVTSSMTRVFPSSLRRDFLDSPTPKLPLLPNPELLKAVPTGKASSILYTDVKESITAGKIFSTPVKKLGLVVMCHGSNDGIDDPLGYLTSWNYLGNCLAVNGFVAVSIKHNGGDGSQKAKEAFLRNIRYVMATYEHQFGLAGKPLILLGHSEGASGAFRAGREIHLGLHPAISAFFQRPAAIIAWAPTETDPAWLGDCADHVLVVQGSHDGDAPAGGLSVRTYELATAPRAKYFCWLHRANHHRVLDGSIINDSKFGTVSWKGMEYEEVLSLESHHLVFQNYATAFLLWKFGDTNIYSRLFTGEAAIDFNGAVPLPSPAALGELSKNFIYLRYNSKLHFPLGSATFVHLYEKMKQVIDAQHPATFAKLSSLDPTCEGMLNTKGFVVFWDKNPSNTRFPEIRVQCPANIMSLKPMALEFDIVQIANSPLNALPQQASIKADARLIHKSGITSSRVEFLVEPSRNMQSTLVLNPQTVARSVLCSVRLRTESFALWGFPLSEFVTLSLLFWKSPVSGRIAIANFRASFFSGE